MADLRGNSEDCDTHVRTRIKSQLGPTEVEFVRIRDGGDPRDNLHPDNLHLSERIPARDQIAGRLGRTGEDRNVAGFLISCELRCVFRSRWPWLRAKGPRRLAFRTQTR